MLVPIALTLVALAGVYVIKGRGNDEPAPAVQPAAQVPSVDPTQQQRLADEQAQWARAFEGQRAQQGAARQAEAASAVVPDGDGSRWQRVQDQEQMRLAAEAKLEEERQRLAAATAGQSQATWSSAPAPQAMSRCSQAKAQRDQAYRVVGNNRTYDFIRQWDDIVFEACKTP